MTWRWLITLLDLKRAFSSLRRPEILSTSVLSLPLIAYRVRSLVNK